MICIFFYKRIAFRKNKMEDCMSDEHNFCFKLTIKTDVSFLLFWLSMAYLKQHWIFNPLGESSQCKPLERAFHDWRHIQWHWVSHDEYEPQCKRFRQHSQKIFKYNKMTRGPRKTNFSNSTAAQRAGTRLEFFLFGFYVSHSWACMWLSGFYQMKWI